MGELVQMKDAIRMKTMSLIVECTLRSSGASGHWIAHATVSMSSLYPDPADGCHVGTQVQSCQFFKRSSEI